MILLQSTQDRANPARPGSHANMSLATLHVHLDDDSCTEVTALKGPSGEVQHYADRIIAERGVRYGRVVMIPTASDKKPKARRQGHIHD